MSKFFALILALYVVQLAGCSWGVVRPPEPLRIEADAPLSDDVGELREELRRLRQRERIVEGALEDAKREALQTKIWIGVGLSVVAGLVLVVLGIWTTRRLLVEIGLGAFALAALGSLVAWVVPYIFWIGLGVAALVIGGAVWMLLNREKALKQVANAVDDAKENIPEFKAGYKRIFQSHIDTAMDRVVHSVRGV